MNLIPRDNFFDIAPLFNNFFHLKDLTNGEAYFSPNVDIVENDDHYEIVADLPGVKKDDINVQLQDGVLSIEAKINEETQSEKDKMIVKERKSGYFSRSFSVGKSVNEDDIKAKFEDGVLTLNCKKSPEVIAKRKRIAIK